MINSTNCLCDQRCRRWALFLMLIWLQAGGNAAFAQDGFFVPVSSAQGRVATPDLDALEKYGLYQIRTSALRDYLAKAPLERNRNAAALQLSIPLPDGTTELFAMTESSMLAPAIAAQHPEIKTYVGRGSTHPGYSIQLSLTSSGFDAIILGLGNSTVYVTKVSRDPTDQRYATYFAHDVKKNVSANPANQSGFCGTQAPPPKTLSGDAGGRLENDAPIETGTTLRTFRLAVSATSEFTKARGNNNQQTAFNEVVNFVSRLNAVYRRELSVAFTLVSGTNTVFTQTNDGGFPVGDVKDKQDKLLARNQVVLDNIIKDENYDVGHVLGYAGASGEGLAASPSTCVSGTKAQGYSGFGDGSIGTFAAIFDDQTLSHEIGHQFGMSHTFNSSIPVCTTREPKTSVEPGAGITIMSYNYICGPNGEGVNDNFETDKYKPLLNFHTVSFEQAVKYIATLDCFTSTSLSNAIPVIGSFTNRTTIPKSTPFALNATASDANGDNLSYSWEGTNTAIEAPTAATLTNTAKGPFFRSYEPVSSGTRIYPRLEAILNGSNNARGDKLPSVGVTTTHRITVRDNKGGVTFKETTVVVADNSGPFLETTNLSGTHPANSLQNISWNVANTTAPPVSCTNVNILLSTDGGQTFPITLLANAPNNGKASVRFPEVKTSQARIKIASSNNVFFDISNANFTIGDPIVLTGAPIVKVSSEDPEATEGGSAAGGRRAAAGGRQAAFEDPGFFQFERSSGVGTLVVNFEIEGTATNGVDFVSLPTSVTFQEGETLLILELDPLEDDIEEDDETIVISLLDSEDYDPDPDQLTTTLTIKDKATATPAPFAITGVTTVSCKPSADNPNKRELTFTPLYTGTNGQSVSFSVTNEMLPTTASGPYSLGIYTDNPTITLKATQNGTPGQASFVYNWLAVCGTTPPVTDPTGDFAITGVTTVSCKPTADNPNKRSLTFTPQYKGANDQPITFSVVNEALPTTAPGPYTLGIYVDNPTITLRATQQGRTGEAKFVYNWLATCNSSTMQSRIASERVIETSLAIRVLGNPIADGRIRVEISGAAGQPLQLMLTDLRGTVINTRSVERASVLETHSFDVGRQPVGTMLLRAATPVQATTVKLLKAE